MFLVPTGEKIATVAFYVRAGDDRTIEHIPDGTYDVFVRMGRDWHESSQSFARGESLKQFEDAFEFKTTNDGALIRSKVWSVTLNPTFDGNTKTRAVVPGDFPAARKVNR